MPPTTESRSSLAKWILFACVAAFAAVAYFIHNQVDNLVQTIHYVFIIAVSLVAAVIVIWLLLIGNVIGEKSRIGWGALVFIASAALTYILFTQKIITLIEEKSGEIFNASIILAVVSAFLLRIRSK